MKKFLSLLIVMLLVVFTATGCALLDSILGGEQQQTPVAATLEEAKAALDELYAADADKETLEGYTLQTSLTVKDTAFTVAWACDNAAITIENGTVTLPIKNKEAVKYTLTATITNAEGATITTTTTRTLPKYDNSPEIPTSVADAIAAGEALEHDTAGEDKLLITGIVTEIKSTQWGNMYITDLEGNSLYIYGLYDAAGTRYDALAEKPQVGDLITVVSYAYNYNGPQLKNATLKSFVAPTALKDVASGEVLVSGIIKEVTDATYGKLVLRDDFGNTLVVDGISDDLGNRFDGLAVAPVKNDVIVVRATAATVEGKVTLSDAVLVQHLPVKEITIKEALEIAAGLANEKYTAEKYIITGTVTSIANTQYGNLTITDKAGDSIFVYGVYNDDGSVRFDALEYQPKVGDIVTLVTVVGKYNDKAQAKSANLSACVEVKSYDFSGEKIQTGGDVVVKNCSIAAKSADGNETRDYIDATTERTYASGAFLSLAADPKNAANQVIKIDTTTGGGSDPYLSSLKFTNPQVLDENGQLYVFEYDFFFESSPNVTGQHFHQVYVNHAENTDPTKGATAGQKLTGAYKGSVVTGKDAEDKDIKVPVARPGNAIGGLHIDAGIWAKTRFVFDMENRLYHAYYSIDDGATWVEAKANGKIVAAVTAIENIALVMTVYNQTSVAYVDNVRFTVVDTVRMNTATSTVVIGKDYAPAGDAGAKVTDLVKFDFGATEIQYTVNSKGENVATHVDYNTDELVAGTSYTEGNYTLTFGANTTQMFASHAINGEYCIKVGKTSSDNGGKLEFTVPSDVDQVTLYVAGWKTSGTYFFANGVQYIATNVSNDGLFKAIVIDTSANKTVTVENIGILADKRLLIDSIVYQSVEGVEDLSGGNTAPAAETYVLSSTGKDNVTYYFNGTADGGKGGITTNAAEAAVVKKEAATGGFYLYIEVAGAKKYIEIGDSSKAFNLVDAPCLLTVNATYNTIQAGTDGRGLALYHSNGAPADIRTYACNDNNFANNTAFALVSAQ